MEVKVRIDSQDGDGAWKISKKFQLSTLPPIGTRMTTTKAGNYVEVESIWLDLDTDTYYVDADGSIEDVRSFYDEGGWQIINDPFGCGKRALAGLP